MYLVLSMFFLVVERDERQRKTKIYTQGREQQRVLIVGTSIRRTQIELAKKITQFYSYLIFIY